MQENLNNKVVVITGGSSGIGEQMAYEAAKEGAIIVVLARRLDRLQKVAEKASGYSKKTAFAYSIDISDPESIESVVDRIHQEVGPIDVLINGAGFGHFETAVDTSMHIVERMFRVNVLGLMYFSQYAAKDMIEREEGSIVNIASMAGKMATPKSAIYSATKFAVVGYSNGLRLELKPYGVHVMTVNPGPIDTDFFKLADDTGDYLNEVNRIVLDPQKLAYRIIQGVKYGKREINAPLIMEIGARLYAIAPHVGDFLASTLLNFK